MADLCVKTTDAEKPRSRLTAGSRPRFALLATALLVVVGTAGSAVGETAYPLHESPFVGRLVRSDAQWNLHFLTGNKVRVLPARELAYYGSYQDVEAGPQIVLVDGSVIRSDLLHMDDEQLVLGDATGLGRGQWDESTLPRSAVRAILFQPPAGRAERDKLLLQLMSDSSNEAEPGADAFDRVLLVGGESVTGTLLSIPPAGRFESDAAEGAAAEIKVLRRGAVDPLGIAAARVVAVRFAEPGRQTRTDDEVTLWLGLKDGSLVHVRGMTIDDDKLTLSLAAGGALQTTVYGRDDPEQPFWDAVTYVRPVSSRVAWLSDLSPIGYKHIPFVSVERAYGTDQSVMGTRLRAGDRVVPKGLGMPSASRLAYDVQGYRKFEAEIAIDEQADLEGSVVFKVLLERTPGEWQVAYTSSIVRGGDSPLPVSIALQGAGRLSLLVDFAERGDVRDYANWLHARLVK